MNVLWARSGDLFGELTGSNQLSKWAAPFKLHGADLWGAGLLPCALDSDRFHVLSSKISRNLQREEILTVFPKEKNELEQQFLAFVLELLFLVEKACRRGGLSVGPRKRS